MRVFRLCDSYEVETLMAYKNPKLLGTTCSADALKNTHRYIEGKKYLHFFANERDLLYLYPSKGKNVCEYDIPKDILSTTKGFGKYVDFINMSKIEKVLEFAIPSEDMKMEYLKKVYLITGDMDFDYFPEKDEIYDCMLCMIDLSKEKQTIEDEER